MISAFERQEQEDYGFEPMLPLKTTFQKGFLWHGIFYRIDIIGLINISLFSHIAFKFKMNVSS